MFKRFIKAMEYRSYCMAIRELRNRGYYKKAEEISEFKNKDVSELLMLDPDHTYVKPKGEKKKGGK